MYEDIQAAGFQENYRRTVRERPDDVPAAQAVICILIAAGLFCTALFEPALGERLFAHLRTLVSEQHELLRNPLSGILH